MRNEKEIFQRFPPRGNISSCRAVDELNERITRKDIPADTSWTLIPATNSVHKFSLQSQGICYASLRASFPLETKWTSVNKCANGQ